MHGDCIESSSIIGIERREVIGWSGDRTVMKPALKIMRFCDFSPEIMFTQFRRIIAEARNENPVNEPSMTKVSKKSAQTGSDSSNSMHDLRNRLHL